jgi:hypothetical protein
MVSPYINFHGFRVSESFLNRDFVGGFAQQNRCCKAAKATKTGREKVFFTLSPRIYHTIKQAFCQEKSRSPKGARKTDHFSGTITP